MSASACRLGLCIKWRCTLVKAEAAFAIHLICRHIDEAPYASIHAAGLQQHVCAICVVDCESQAVAKAIVHMSLQNPQQSLQGLDFMLHSLILDQCMQPILQMLSCGMQHEGKSMRLKLFHATVALECSPQQIIFRISACCQSACKASTKVGRP